MTLKENISYIVSDIHIGNDFNRIEGFTAFLKVILKNKINKKLYENDSIELLAKTPDEIINIINTYIFQFIKILLSSYKK